MSVLPHQEAVLAWQMVAYSAGYQTLPQVELTSRQHSVLLNATHGRRVHVLPAQMPTADLVLNQAQSPGEQSPNAVDNLADSMSQLNYQSITA